MGYNDIYGRNQLYILHAMDEIVFHDFIKQYYSVFGYKILEVYFPMPYSFLVCIYYHGMNFNFVWYSPCYFLTMTLWAYQFLVNPKALN